jgi:1-acyl-sn-glycerol-3-phosphate acyltransferase
MPELEPRDFPTAWARTEAGKAARAALQRYGLAPLINAEVSPRVEGLDVLSSIAPPVIFVANHSSHLDAPLVLTSLPPAWRARTATGAAADYFFDVWWRAAATALVFNAFPVERARGKGRTTRLARDLIAEGWNILVFPEGTRSKDGWVRDFRLGAARLAVEAGVPVVPIGMRGSYQSMPRGKGWPAKGRLPVSVRFGRPVRPEPGEDATAFNARVRAGLAVTLDEESTTWWEATRRAALGAVPSIDGPEGAGWRRVWEASRPLPKARRAFPRR